MKLCSMKLESCIKIDRVAHLKTEVKLNLDRTCPIPYNLVDETFFPIFQ